MTKANKFQTRITLKVVPESNLQVIQQSMKYKVQATTKHLLI